MPAILCGWTVITEDPSLLCIFNVSLCISNLSLPLSHTQSFYLSHCVSPIKVVVYLQFEKGEKQLYRARDINKRVERIEMNVEQLEKWLKGWTCATECARTENHSGLYLITQEHNDTD